MSTAKYKITNVNEISMLLTRLLYFTCICRKQTRESEGFGFFSSLLTLLSPCRSMLYLARTTERGWFLFDRGIKTRLHATGWRHGAILGRRHGVALPRDGYAQIKPGEKAGRRSRGLRAGRSTRCECRRACQRTVELPENIH